ncbi:Acyl-CoA transferase [Sulfitobacter geojensis]|nr:Acyl-CoA transferase [Sulfitobacter geojensis]
MVDMSQGVAGPYSAMLMAQYGADVIKIEPGKTGDWSRILGHQYGDHTAYSIAANMGKRSIIMDMKNADADAVLVRMVQNADVFIEGFRPGVADRLGCSYERLSEINPRLIYVSISGFGQNGPMREAPGTDQILQAFTGYMSDNRCDADKPQRSTSIFYDMAAGMYAYQAISTSLFSQRIRGHENGRKIDISLLESAAALQAVRVMNGYREGPFRPTSPPSGTFKASDGWIQIIIIRGSEFEAFCRLIGHPEWASDSRFNSNADRRKNMAVLMELVQETLLTKPVLHWTAILSEAGLQNQAVMDYPTFVEHPQTKAVQAISWINQTGDDTPWPIPNIPGMPSFTQESPRSMAPTLGQHSRDILVDLGFQPAEIDALAASGAFQ